MTVVANPEKMGFQTEVKQLLKLMIHSLYSHPEIFLRELVSNASDAADKLRFASLKNSVLMEDNPNLDIRITFDKESKIITIKDNGIGMDRQEVIDNLGTIAKSGTGDFLKNMSGDQKKDAQLIGQFGVGFYSAFIVADEVTVETRKAGDKKDQGVRWQSKGDGEFTIEGIEKAERGTTITLHLKTDHADFADSWRLRSVITKYSDHISLPIMMQKEVTPELDEEGKEKSTDEQPKQLEWETVNTAKALWTRPRSKIEDNEYLEFYKHISHDYAEPLTWSHNQVEGKLEYTSLLYIPTNPPFDLYNRDMQRGLKLFVQRVFIMDEAEQFLPMYLRFVKGVIDSNDLSLNISREILQKDPQVDSMKSALTRRVLDMLEKLAKKDTEKYTTFWKNFGQVLKEGPAEDFSNREKISSLLRFASTHTKNTEQTVSLDDYISRMKPEQDKIYYITAETFNAANNSPHLEIFHKKGIEVLLMSDRVDEWLMSHLNEYKEKKFADIGRGDLELGQLDDEQEKKKHEEAVKTHEELIKRIKSCLENQVSEIKITHRLTSSPACLVVGEHDMGFQMRKIMEASGQSMPENKPVMEINPEHTLIIHLDHEQDEDRFKDFCSILFDQAQLARGGQLDDPAAYVKKINTLILKQLS